MTISQSNPRPLRFKWRENRLIMLYEALHVRPTNLLKLQISLSIWNVTDGFSRPTVYVFLSVSAYTVCVCLCVCVWLWQGSFQTPQTLMNGSLCVRNCVYVWSTVTFAHSFSHRCKIFFPLRILILSLIPASTHVRTHRVHMFPIGCCTAAASEIVSCKFWLARACLFHLPDTVPAPVVPWIISELQHHRPRVQLVTHTYRHVAICSTSRHATMTKYQRDSKLLWLHISTGQKPINPELKMIYWGSILPLSFPPGDMFLLLNGDHKSMWRHALILPLMTRTRFFCCTAVFQCCAQSIVMNSASTHGSVQWVISFTFEVTISLPWILAIVRRFVFAVVLPPFF